MATHSSILAWRIPWTEEPSGLQSIGLQRVGHDWETKTYTDLLTYYSYAAISMIRSDVFWRFLKSKLSMLFLFIMVKSWKHLRCPLVVEWTVEHLDNGEILSIHWCTIIQHWKKCYGVMKRHAGTLDACYYERSESERLHSVRLRLYVILEKGKLWIQ